MPRKPKPREESPALKQFRDSMTMDFDRWHDGVGYDMAVFARLSDAEKQVIVKEIRAKGNGNLDWRDMEVLQHANSRQSLDILREVLANGTCEQRAQALGRMNDSLFDAQLAQLLDDVTDDDGLTATLLLVADEPGPRTLAALERGVRQRPAVALHFAAKLLDAAGLGGPDTAGFHPKFRPTLLKLLPSEKPAERAKAIEQVFAWLGS